MKSDVLLLAFTFEKILKVLVNEFGINPLCCASLPVYTYLQTLQDKDLILTIEKNIRSGISRRSLCEIR